MTEPKILCFCPDPGSRPEYTKSVMECMKAQTHPNVSIMLYDTSAMHKTVGMIRNEGVRAALDKESCDIIAHFDFDDWSHPTRLAEQLAFMEEVKLPVVGYSDIPFYDEQQDKVYFYDSRNIHYSVGTALMYRREVWEKTPFPDKTPEDTEWQNRVGRINIKSQSTLRHSHVMMVQRIHAKNASARVALRAAVTRPADEELDRHVRRALGLTTPRR